MVGTGVVDNTPVVWLLTDDALLVVERGMPMSHAREVELTNVESAGTERSGAGWALALDPAAGRPLQLSGLEAAEAHRLLDAVTASQRAA